MYILGTLILFGMTPLAIAQITVEHYKVTGYGQFDNRPANIQLSGTVESWPTYDFDLGKVTAREYKYSGRIQNTSLSLDFSYSGTQLDDYFHGVIKSNPITSVEVSIRYDGATSTNYLQIWMWDRDYTRTFEIGRFQVVFEKVE